MRSLRERVTALVVVLTLLAAAPVTAGRACGVCPVDCPMHEQASARSGKRHVGCHQGHVDDAPADRDTDCALRAAGCGHSPVMIATGLPVTVVPDAATPSFPRPAARTLPATAVQWRTLPAPQPPPGPPRPLVV